MTIKFFLLTWVHKTYFLQAITVKQESKKNIFSQILKGNNLMTVEGTFLLALPQSV